MNKRGTAALEAIIASGAAMLLLIAVTGQLLIFWTVWQESNQLSRQRQWAAVAFDYLDRDMKDAQRVQLFPGELRVDLEGGSYVYRVTADKSFYRATGNRYFPLATVQSVGWWREGELVWVELVFPNECYSCCYFIPEAVP